MSEIGADASLGTSSPGLQRLVSLQIVELESSSGFGISLPDPPHGPIGSGYRIWHRYRRTSRLDRSGPLADDSGEQILRWEPEPDPMIPRPGSPCSQLAVRFEEFSS